MRFKLEMKTHFPILLTCGLHLMAAVSFVAFNRQCDGHVSLIPDSFENF